MYLVVNCLKELKNDITIQAGQAVLELLIKTLF